MAQFFNFLEGRFSKVTSLSHRKSMPVSLLAWVLIAPVEIVDADSTRFLQETCNVPRRLAGRLAGDH